MEKLFRDLHGKEKIDKLVQHPMLCVNTAKAHNWMVARGLQLPTRPNLIAGSNGRILTPKDLVKYKFATEQSFSLSGRGMIDAVDLGVMAREGQMQRLVSYARKNPASARLAGFFQRTGRDSNPRYAFDVHTISNLLSESCKLFVLSCCYF